MKTPSYSWYQRRVKYLNEVLGDHQSAKAIRDAQLQYERAGLGYTPDTARLMEYGRDIRHHNPATEGVPPQLIELRWSAYISQNPTAYRIARGGYTHAKPTSGGAALFYKQLPDGRVERFNSATRQVSYLKSMPKDVKTNSLNIVNNALKAEGRRTGRRRKTHPFNVYD